jgi:dolichol-phosphate mannosyltransferase
MPSKLVIIPTYNEIENIRKIIEKVLSLKGDFHLLIVDDNSPDGTSDIVKSLIEKYAGRLFIEERSGKQGLGTAYIHGFKWGLARDYDYLFEMDADFSHNPNDLIRLYEACEKGGNHLAIGSRYATGVNVVNWPMGRVMMSYYASVYVRYVTGMPFHDATAGFKCYSAKVLKAIDLDKIRFKGYAFQIEMKFTTWKMGFKVIEVPIIFTDRKEGSSKMSTGIFKEAFFGVIYLRLSSIFKKYPQYE